MGRGVRAGGCSKTCGMCQFAFFEPIEKVWNLRKKFWFLRVHWYRRKQFLVPEKLWYRRKHKNVAQAQALIQAL